jgi:hypothetical protein
MHALGSKLFDSSVNGYFREVEPNTDGKKSRDLLADFYKKYTDDLFGMRHECIFVGGPHPCANRMDGLHIGELRSGLTAHIEKATFILGTAVTQHGKELFTGAAKYKGLQGSGNPMTCMKDRVREAGMKTHPCRNNKKLTCLQQCDGHCWVKFMDMPELGDCLPPSYAQARLYQHSNPYTSPLPLRTYRPRHPPSTGLASRSRAADLHHRRDVIRCAALAVWAGVGLRLTVGRGDSHAPSRPPALPPSRPPALPPYRPTTLPPYRPTALPPYRPTALPPYRPTALPPYSTALPCYHPYCPTSHPWQLLAGRADFKRLEEALVPMRITPAGHEVSWHAINMHKLLDHLVVDFPRLCGNPIGMSFFDLRGLESKHSSTKHHREKHSFSAALVVSKINNKATLGLRSQTRHDRSNMMRSGLLRAADASLTRKVNSITSRALRARRSKNSRLASARCRTQGLDSRVDWATGESTLLETACEQHRLITGSSISLVAMMSPDETEAAEGAAGERVGDAPDEEDAGVTPPVDTPPVGGEEAEDAEHDESETEAELEARQLVGKVGSAARPIGPPMALAVLHH